MVSVDTNMTLYDIHAMQYLLQTTTLTETTQYRFAKDTSWTGGTVEYSSLHESSPYWFNYIGLLPS